MLPGSKDKPAAKPEDKPRKKRSNAILAIVVLIIAIVIIGLVFMSLQGGHNEVQPNTLTVVNETQFISTHLANETITSNKVLILDQYAGASLKNTQLNMVEHYYNGNNGTAGNGTLNVTKIVANTPGLKIVSITPALPVTVPNSPSQEAGNVSVKVTFDYPSLPYTGPLNFSVYFDYYPNSA